MTASALVQLRNRIVEMETLAKEVDGLALRLLNCEEVQPDLANKGQQWYRGCREIMAQQRYSGREEFEDYYASKGGGIKQYFVWSHNDFSPFDRSLYDDFSSLFMAARALVSAVEAEILSRELPVKTELSYEVAATEFDTARQMLDEGKAYEVFIRASGMIARVALERHLFTVADARSLTIAMNPPSKKHPDASDVVNTLSKAGVITPVQRSHIEALLAVANNCAHPTGRVVEGDVERLIRQRKQLAAMIL